MGVVLFISFFFLSGTSNIAIGSLGITRMADPVWVFCCCAIGGCVTAPFFGYLTIEAIRSRREKQITTNLVFVRQAE